MRVLGEDNPVQLLSVIGNNVSNNSHFCQSNDKNIFFLAGASIRQFNLENKAEKILTNESNRQITCFALSDDGKHIITGEARLYSADDFSLKYSFSGHKFKINCVKFCPKGNSLVTIGSPEDQSVYLWNRSSFKRIASSKTCNLVNAVAFSQVFDFFVTAGSRIIKFWYPKLLKKKSEEVPLDSRNVILNDNLYNNFVDILLLKDNSDSEFIYVLSTNSCVLKIDSKRQVISYVKLENLISKCMTNFNESLLIGHNQRKMTLLSLDSLESLSRLELPQGQEKPINDIISIGYNSDQRLATIFFTDFSFEIWSIESFKENEMNGFIPLHIVYQEHCHSDVIWSVMPISQNTIQYMYLSAKSTEISLFGEKIGFEDLKKCFFSSSEDGTVILWKIVDPIMDFRNEKFHDDHPQPSEDPITSLDALPLLSKEADKVIIYKLDVQKVFHHFLLNNGDEVKRNQKLLNSISFGLKCLSMNDDCSHLAIGNKTGELMIFSVQQKDALLFLVNAHESEVTCLNYFLSSTDPSLHILGTGGRDRLIRLWNVSANYKPLYTISDHSGSINFLSIYESQQNCDSLPTIRLVSSSSDKSIIFRTLESTSKVSESKFQIYSQLMSKSSQASATVLPKFNNLYVLCQDRKIRVYSMDKGRPMFTIKANPFRDGPMGVCTANFDGSVLAISSSDKRISLLCPFSGNLFSILSGHSETITSMTFLQTRRHLITTSCDHTIFVWQLPNTFERTTLCQSTIDVSAFINFNTNQQALKFARKSPTQFNWHEKIPQNINLNQYFHTSLIQRNTKKRLLDRKQKISPLQVNHSTPNARSTSVPPKMLNRFTSQDSMVNSEIFDNESDFDSLSMNHPSQMDSSLYSDFDLMPKWAKDKSVQSLNNLNLEHSRIENSYSKFCYNIDESLQKPSKRLTTSLYEPIELKVQHPQLTSSSSGIGHSTSPSIKSYRVHNTAVMNPRGDDRKTLVMNSYTRTKPNSRQDKYSSKKRSDDLSESSISSSSSRVRACWSKSVNCDVSIKPDSSRRNSSTGKFSSFSVAHKPGNLLDDEKDSSSSTITSIKENSRLSDSSKLNISLRRPTLICNFFSKLALELDKLNDNLGKSHWSPGELNELQQAYLHQLEPRLEKLNEKIGIPDKKVSQAQTNSQCLSDQDRFDYVRQVMDTILPKMQDLQLYLKSTESISSSTNGPNFDSDPPTISSEIVYEPSICQKSKSTYNECLRISTTASDNPSNMNQDLGQLKQ